MKDSNRRMFKHALLFSGVIAVGYGLMQAFDLDIFCRQINPLRLSGFHRNPYTYGGQLILFFFLFLGEWHSIWGKPSRQKNDVLKSIFYFCISVATLYCTFNTSERAVIFGVIIGLFVYCFAKLFIGRSSIKDILPLMVLIALPFVFTRIFNRTVIKRIRRVLFPKKTAKLNPRFKLWDIAILSWKKNLFFGTGKYPVVYNQISEDAPIQILTHAHSLYLQFLVSHGIIGLLAFLNLVGALFAKLLKAIKHNQYALAMVAALVAFLIEGIFEYNWGDSEVRFLWLYALGYVVSLIASSEDVLISKV